MPTLPRDLEGATWPRAHSYELIPAGEIGLHPGARLLVSGFLPHEEKENISFCS